MSLLRNVCQNCFIDEATRKVQKSPLSKEKIKVCDNCYFEFYDPELLEDEVIEFLENNE